MTKKFSSNLKAIYDWYRKIAYLKENIDALELLDFSITKIAGFLLKTQLIEFELRELLSNLDMHMRFASQSSVLKLKTRIPTYFEEKFTLGKLIEEINRFDGEFLANVKPKLGRLRVLRNDFTHHLFSVKSSLDQLFKDSEEGIILSNEILEELSEIEEFLDKNDPLDPIIEKFYKQKGNKLKKKGESN